jgi:hypothetical protein
MPERHPPVCGTKIHGIVSVQPLGRNCIIHFVADAVPPAGSRISRLYLPQLRYISEKDSNRAVIHHRLTLMALNFGAGIWTINAFLLSFRFEIYRV